MSTIRAHYYAQSNSRRAVEHLLDNTQLHDLEGPLDVIRRIEMPSPEVLHLEVNTKVHFTPTDTTLLNLLGALCYLAPTSCFPLRDVAHLGPLTKRICVETIAIAWGLIPADCGFWPTEKADQALSIFSQTAAR